MRVLKGVKYMLKRIRLRTEPWVHHLKWDREEMQSQRKDQRKSEILSKF